MRMLRWAAVGIMLVFGVTGPQSWAAGSPPPAGEPTFDMEGIGSPVIAHPTAPPTAAVVLLSGAEGWGEAERAASAALVGTGAVVIGIDTPATLARMARKAEADRKDADGKKSCSILIGEIEAVSHQIQRQLGSAAYHFPVVAGRGLGGTLALALAGQTEAATVAGLVGVDPEPALPGAGALCSSSAVLRGAVGTVYDLPAPPSGARLPFTVSVVRSASASPAARERISALTGSVAMVRTSDRAGAEALLEAVESAQPVAACAGAARASAADVADLPLVPLPVGSPSDVLVILYSGDGGWRDLDKDVAALFQEQGVPVVGVDALRYFWSDVSPETGARDLSRIIRAYTAEWNARRVILVGFSFGADVLPFLMTRLPQQDRDRVVMLSLLGLSTKAEFEVTVSNWLVSRKSAAARDTIPEIGRIDPRLVQCQYGLEDDEAACALLKGTGVEVISTSGGHHFDGDYPALARRILEGVSRRSHPGTAP